mmetsp:Transcript_22051/g.68205  ORF Transcript_22051/g.68205 Transcript_22051/m.68205 type:complete len:203 (-) Transcript_22051:903-1511(-)
MTGTGPTRLSSERDTHAHRPATHAPPTELDRVRHEVLHNLSETHLVANDHPRHARLHLVAQLHPPASSIERVRLEHQLHASPQIKRCCHRLLGIQSFGLRQVKRLIAQEAQLLAGGNDDVHQLALLIGHGRFRQKRGAASDRMHRRAHFVTHVGHKSALRQSRRLGCLVRALRLQLGFLVCRHIHQVPENDPLRRTLGRELM